MHMCVYQFEVKVKGRFLPSHLEEGGGEGWRDATCVFSFFEHALSFRLIIFNHVSKHGCVLSCRDGCVRWSCAAETLSWRWGGDAVRVRRYGCRNWLGTVINTHTLENYNGPPLFEYANHHASIGCGFHTFPYSPHTQSNVRENGHGTFVFGFEFWTRCEEDAKTAFDMTNPRGTAE